MTEAVKVAIIVAIPPTLAAPVGMFASLRNGKKVAELHVLVNSRLTQLLNLTASSSRAEGKLAAENTERQKTQKA